MIAIKEGTGNHPPVCETDWTGVKSAEENYKAFKHIHEPIFYKMYYMIKGILTTHIDKFVGQYLKTTSTRY